MITTALTTRCGIKYPIMQGGMQWVGTCDLAAAVSAAGGLGMLTALSHSSPEHLRAEIRRLRTLTDRPFGVNLTILPAIAPPDYMAFARVMVEEGVRIVETAGNKPAEYVRLFKDAQMVVIHKCTSVRHAVSAQRMGVDFVSIDGFECAGHPGEDDVGGVVLLVRAAQELSIPFVASGGFADGRGLAGALALGACGVNMGTRFMCSAEAPVHPRIKQCIVAASESDTALMFRTMHNTARVYRNTVAAQVVAAEKRGASFADIRHLVAGERGRLVYTTGDPEAGVWSIGQVAGVIKDIPTCRVLVERIGTEAEQILARLAASITASKL